MKSWEIDNTDLTHPKDLSNFKGTITHSQVGFYLVARVTYDLVGHQFRILAYSPPILLCCILQAEILTNAQIVAAANTILKEHHNRGKK